MVGFRLSRRLLHGRLPTRQQRYELRFLEEREVSIETRGNVIGQRPRELLVQVRHMELIEDEGMPLQDRNSVPVSG